RTCVFLLLRADEGAVFDTCDVGRVGQGEIRVLALGGVQALERAGGDHLLAETVIFFLRTVAPVNTLRLGQRGDFRNPGHQLLVLDPGRDVQRRRALHRGVVHTATPKCKGKEEGKSFQSPVLGRQGRRVLWLTPVVTSRYNSTAAQATQRVAAFPAPA